MDQRQGDLAARYLIHVGIQMVGMPTGEGGGTRRSAQPGETRPVAESRRDRQSDAGPGRSDHDRACSVLFCSDVVVEGGTSHLGRGPGAALGRESAE